MIEARGGDAQRHIHRDDTVGNQSHVGDALRAITEPPHIEVVESRRGARHNEATVWPGARRNGRADQENVDARQREFGRDIGHNAHHPRAPSRLGRFSGCLRGQRRERGGEPQQAGAKGRDQCATWRTTRDASEWKGHMGTGRRRAKQAGKPADHTPSWAVLPVHDSDCCPPFSYDRKLSQRRNELMTIAPHRSARWGKPGITTFIG